MVEDTREALDDLPALLASLAGAPALAGYDGEALGRLSAEYR